ncbi:hypothetical protein AB0I16_18205 [Streptomyces sp. NPDC050703]|uniref:hypothetical protein n=1 Tax=Streptomyces sp. NPDC050703 TaxID=3157218 RepID=UPI00342FC4BC
MVPRTPMRTRRCPIAPLVAGSVMRRGPADCARARPLDGGASRLVRPYLAAWEDEERARLRRDTLRWVTYGVDLDVRDIHRTLEPA